MIFGESSVKNTNSCGWRIYVSDRTEFDMIVRKNLIQSDDERDMNENSDEKFDFSYCYEYSEIHLSKTLEIRMNSIQMNHLEVFVPDRTGFNM